MGKEEMWADIRTDEPGELYYDTPLLGIGTTGPKVGHVMILRKMTYALLSQTLTLRNTCGEL